MPKIFYDANLITKDEIDENRELIIRLQNGELKYPQVKKLKGINFGEKPVGRAKLDKKRRLIYTYELYNGENTLCILAVNNHNYAHLKRQLKSTAASMIKEVDLPQLPIAAADYELLPAVSNKEGMIVWDEQQQACHVYPDPVIFYGPPGAGKTVVLYNNMLRNLYAQQHNTEGRQPVLFISQSGGLVESLQLDYKSTGLPFEVRFFTWLKYLAFLYPAKPLLKEEHFKEWFKAEKWTENSREIHYEFSLIAALGEKKYLQLGKRQCHYSGDKIMQGRLISLFKKWQTNVESVNGIDPMIQVINSATETNFAEIYCDETQNLPPVALFSLVNMTNRYAASMDIEQCLLSSPFIHNYLKELLFERHQKYQEITLAKTWRCPPEIMNVANHLKNFQHQIDSSGNRRPYRDVQSMLPEKSGVISWVDNKNFSKLQKLCQSAKTVVIVETATEELRKIIQKELCMNNILTPKEAIGLEFDNIILFNPISQRPCLKELAQAKPGSVSELSLEQSNALNAIFVCLTRAKKNFFIYDEAQHRWPEFLQALFGKLPHNQINTDVSLEETSKKEWMVLVSKYLDEGQFDNARQILHFHLGFGEDIINAMINPRMTANPMLVITPPVSIITPTVKFSINARRSINNRSRAHKVSDNHQASPPVMIKTAQDKAKDAWEKFNNDTLVNLFNQPDCMDILFNHKTNNYSCLFTACMVNKAKRVIFHKFIKQNQQIISEKFDLQKLLETKPIFSTNFLEKRPQEISLIGYLYLEKKQVIVQDLLKAYSIARKVSFLIDCVIYTGHNIVMLLDDILMSQLNKGSTEGLVELLCKTAVYDQTWSYAAHLCLYRVGLPILERVIDNPILLQHLYDNLYFMSTRGESLFLKLCTYTEGIEFLSKLYVKNPGLAHQLTLKNLITESSTFPSAFYLLSKDAKKGLPLLNFLVTPELAALVQHELPHIGLLSNLSRHRDGVKLITTMLNSQPEMIKEITGVVLSTMDDKNFQCCIFRKLADCSAGVAVLERVLNFHGRQLVNELDDDAMFEPWREHGFSAYDKLQQTDEGRLFLKNLHKHGWTPPVSWILAQARDLYPLPLQAGLFSVNRQSYCFFKKLQAKPVEILLWHLSTENKYKVTTMLTSKPGLLLEKGSFTDTSGRHFKNISPVEYCQNNGRQHFYNIMVDCLGTNREALRVKKALKEIAGIDSKNCLS